MAAWRQQVQGGGQGRLHPARGLGFRAGSTARLHALLAVPPQFPLLQMGMRRTPNWEGDKSDYGHKQRLAWRSTFLGWPRLGDSTVQGPAAVLYLA